MAFMDKMTRSEEGAIRMFASLAMSGKPPLEEAVELNLVAFVPIPASWSKKKQQEAEAGMIYPTGRPDLDNIKKLVCDAMNSVVFKDDSQIVSAYSAKRYSRNPRITVRVRSSDPMDGML